MIMPPKSYTLVAIQFIMLALIGLTGPWLARGLGPLLLELGGVALGLWAIATMRLGNFNIMPEVKPTGHFVHSGPYRLIRHPMYLALLLVTLGLVMTEFSIWRFVFWVVLLVDLLVKIEYEERLLAVRFAEYAAYAAATKRLLPWVY